MTEFVWSNKACINSVLYKLEALKSENFQLLYDLFYLKRF